MLFVHCNYPTTFTAHLPLPCNAHASSSSQKGQSHILVLTCYARWVELCQTLQLFLARNLSRIRTGHQMAFSGKACTASVTRLSGSTRIKRYPCRRRSLVQQLASEIQEQQHTMWLKMIHSSPVIRRGLSLAVEHEGNPAITELIIYTA